MMTFSIIIIILLCTLFIAFRLLQINPFKPLKKGILKVDEYNREFHYYVPEKIKENPRLIFVLHGSAMSYRTIQLITSNQFNKLADKHQDTIIVYPQGYLKYWNDCRKEASYKAKELNINDVGFIEKIIDFFAEKYSIDTLNVFVAGYSNGGHMGYKLAKQRPDLFKGFAIISASLPVETNDDCVESKKPVSILVMNGTSDPINPYMGGKVLFNDGENRGNVLSTEATMKYWITLNKCTEPPEEHDFPMGTRKIGNTRVARYIYSCLETGKQTVLIQIVNGGHVVPGPFFYFWPRYLGNVNRDINGPEVIWDFFEGLKNTVQKEFFIKKLHTV